MEREAAFLAALAAYGIRLDMQEVLVRGNPDLGIRPGALTHALAAIQAVQMEAVARRSAAADGPPDPLGRPTYDALIAALAQCREAIPDDPDDDVERTSAIAYPLFVPDLVKKFVARSEAERDEQPKPSVFIPSNEILVSRDDIIEMCAATVERHVRDIDARPDSWMAAWAKECAAKLRSLTSQPAQEAE